MIYRFKARIEDEDGNVIAACSTEIEQGDIKVDGGCERVEMELWPMLRNFRKHELSEPEWNEQ